MNRRGLIASLFAGLFAPKIAKALPIVKPFVATDGVPVTIETDGWVEVGERTYKLVLKYVETSSGEDVRKAS